MPQSYGFKLAGKIFYGFHEPLFGAGFGIDASYIGESSGENRVNRAISLYRIML